MNAQAAKDDDELADDDEKSDDENEDDEDEESEGEEDEESDEDDEDADEDADDADEDDEEDDENEDDEEEPEDEAEVGADGEPEHEDPTWWTPYAVLGGLLLIGLLGFFGLFNRWLGFLATSSAAGHAGATESSATVAAAAPASSARARETQPARSGETFGAKHILVMHKDSRRVPPGVTRTKDEALARATEAAKRVKKGESFEALVKEYSDEPGAAARGGNLGKFRRGTMVPPFQAAVEKLKVGETSDPVETPFGYHIIVRTE